MLTTAEIRKLLRENPEAFTDNFNALCIERGIAQSTVAEIIGVHVSALAEWQRGRKPHCYHIRRIAAFFRVEPERLLKNTEDIQNG